MKTAQTHQAIQVAQTIVLDYFKTLEVLETRQHLLSWFWDQSAIFWNGSEWSGLSEINHFLSALPEMEFKIATYDVQSVLQARQLCMVTVTGTVAENLFVHKFHSTFYVEIELQKGRGLILYQEFKCL